MTLYDAKSPNLCLLMTILLAPNSEKLMNIFVAYVIYTLTQNENLTRL